MLDRILIGSSAEPTDTNFKNVTLLLHGDGSNGAQNNTFIDSSTNNFTITRNGNTTQGSFSPYGSNWSNYFDGSGDCLTVPYSTALQLPGNFTIETWVYLNARVTGFPCIVANYSSYTTNGGFALFAGHGANTTKYTVSFNGSFPVLTSSSNIAYGTWTHIAIVRSGTTLTLYINGVSEATATNSATVTGTQDNWWIATSGDSTTESYINGYVSNLRVVKGTAVYTSNFTPPTQPLTAVSGTSLLTCAYNRFRDGSTNNFTITRNGDVKVTNFAPFAPSSAYSTTTNGGSAYMDGSGDDLRITYSSTMAAGTGAYSVEAWVYLTSSNTYQGITGTSSDGFCGFEKNAGFWGYYFGTVGQQSTTPCVLYQWNHLVVCRDGSGNGAFFVNGVRAATFTDTANKTSFGNLMFGFNGVGGGQYMQGYATEYRYVKGSNPYNPSSTTVTIPTAPITAVTGTVALMRCQNAAIFDNSMKNDLETVGNAQISTSVKKFGTGSMYFDGSGDWLSIPDTDAFDMGSGNFTAEAWIYPTSLANEAMIMGQWSGDTGSTTLNWALMFSSGSTGYLRLITSSNGSGVLFDLSTSSTSFALSTNTWYHIAAVRNGSTFTIYVDGTSRATTTNSSSLYNATNAFTIGAESNTQAQYFTGYIDELRVTKGVARYTANFTAPTAPFPNK